MHPARYQNLAEARRQFGGRVDHYGTFLMEGDPLADAYVAEVDPDELHAQLGRALKRGVDAVPDAPDSLRALLSRAEYVPAWVDWGRVAHGARTFQRMGESVTLILSAVSLMRGYHSAAVNRPLVSTAQLDTNARVRLGLTGRYVYEVSQEDGLRRDRPGFHLSLVVRVMHARVRRMLMASDHWDTGTWGVPINQADMVATGLSFSHAIIAGASAIGFHFDEDEAADLLHLWRYASFLMGVTPELLWDGPEDADRLARLIDMTQPGADAWSPVLAQALRDVVKQASESRGPLYAWRLNYFDGVTRALHGDTIANELQIPDTPWVFALPATRMAIKPIEALRRVTPGANRLLAYLGNRAIEASVERSLEGQAATFRIPTEVSSASRYGHDGGGVPRPPPRDEGAIYDYTRGRLGRLGRRLNRVGQMAWRALRAAG